MKGLSQNRLKVKVRLWGILGKYHPGGTPREPLEVPLPGAATVAALLEALDLPKPYQERAVVFRGDDQIHGDQPLADGDELHLLLPSAGGGAALRSDEWAKAMPEEYCTST